MALYTPISNDQLADVLRRYALPPPDRTLPEPKGSVNTNYHLWSGGRRWFLRLNEGKTVEDVAFEAEVLRFLAREGFPAVPLVLARDGAPQVEVAGRPAMLFAFVEGDCPHRPPMKRQTPPSRMNRMRCESLACFATSPALVAIR